MTDAFDFREEKKPEINPEINTKELVWNTLTILMVLNTVIVGILILTIFVNPFTGMNPFPPAPWTPTPTPTPRQVLPPTWTPTVTPVLPPTHTPEPTITPYPTQENTGGESPGSSTQEVSPFVVADGSPQYIANLYHPDLGCKWLGVAGQVFDVSGAPLKNLMVEVGGYINGEPVSMITATGVAVNYGESGFEFVLGENPTTSSQSLWLQLVDQAGLPISEKFYFDTYENCDQNLVLINFRQLQ